MCEQIGLFRRVKIRKSPICSHVIPYCFEKKDQFPFNYTATVNTCKILHGGAKIWILCLSAKNNISSECSVLATRKKDQHVPSFQHEV